LNATVPTLALELAYSVVGAAERNAISTEQHARARGAGVDELGDDVGSILDGAACHSDLDALALLQWRITRTTQAIGLLDLTGPRGTPEPLLRSILLTTAALSGLLAATVTMRNMHRPRRRDTGRRASPACRGRRA